MEYAAKISKEGKYMLAEFPDCAGCQTFVEKGESIEDAARDALEGWLESNLARDLAPPRPSVHRGAGVISICIASGLAVRLELRWARAAAGLTQAELARRIGISQQAVQKLESRNANPTIQTLERVARGLGGSVYVSFTQRDQFGMMRDFKQSRNKGAFVAARTGSSKVTSAKVAAKASKISGAGRSSAASKSVAASDLAQARGKSKSSAKHRR